MQLCDLGSDESRPSKSKRTLMKVDEIHVHAVCEKIEVLHYFRFATEGFVFSLLISISHILGNLHTKVILCLHTKPSH